jgi:hypothetical protein
MPPKQEDEHVEVPLNDEDEELAKNEIPEDMRPREQEPTFFSDHRGNLKAVNMVVRHPCKIFWLILIMCFGLAFLLQVLVWRTAEDGNPFTAPEVRNLFDHEIDMESISIQNYSHIYSLHRRTSTISATSDLFSMTV